MTIVAASPVSAKEIAERKWIHMESEHFSIHSNAPKRKTRNLLRQLEAMRLAVLAEFQLPDDALSKPTVLVLLGRSSDLEKIGYKAATDGILIPGATRYLIVLRNAYDVDEMQVVMHGYAHQLLDAMSRHSLPRWYKEGFAEYVGSSQLTGQRLYFGINNPARIETLQNYGWLPWEQVLSTNEIDHLSPVDSRLFFAQSWMLTHFLQNKTGYEGSVAAAWKIYESKINENVTPVAAFQIAFGISMDEISPALRQYFRRGKFRYFQIDTEKVLPEFNPPARTMTVSEVQAVLNEVRFSRAEFATAAKWSEQIGGCIFEGS